MTEDNDHIPSPDDSTIDTDKTSPLPDDSTQDIKGITPVVPSAGGLLIGTKIGSCTLSEVIGSGGMGTVYLAIQETPRREVALKMMKRGIASKDALTRFQHESHILANLQHPGIAQVYEAGTHDDGVEGLPYFVMEYIANAKTITEYADDEGLGTRERLALFTKVCDAVQYGHLKGIVHRDLKPGNILVDSSGRPKIIDFGVARSTDSDLVISTAQTDVGQLIGTLQYMSPEQCVADPNKIDGRSDVYSLGVVLYELLVGKLPYDLKQMAMFEALRVVREEEPTKLSTINRHLRGDLEVVSFKALEKEQSRRYQSANALQEDIQRYLDDEPISAKPPSAIDYLKRFARKHTAVAVAIASVFFILVVAVIGVLTFAFETDRQRDIADLRTAEAILSNDKTSRKSYQYLLANLLNDASRLEIEISHSDRDWRTEYQLSSDVEIAKTERISEAFDIYKKINLNKDINFEKHAPIELKLASSLLSRRIETPVAVAQTHLSGYSGIGEDRVYHKISPDKRYSLIQTDHRNADYRFENSFAISDLRSGAVVFEEMPGSMPLFSADSKSIFCSVNGDIVQRFDMETAELVQTYVFKAPSKPVAQAFLNFENELRGNCPDISHLIDQILRDGFLNHHQFQEFEPSVHNYLWHKYNKDNAAIDQGERSTYIDSTIESWNLRSTREIRAIACHPNGLVITVGFSDGSIEFRAIDSGEMISLIRKGEGQITSLLYNHDGKLLAAGDSAGRVQIWRWRSKELIYKYREPMESPLLSMDFHPLRNEIAFTFRGDEEMEFSGAILNPSVSKIMIRNLSELDGLPSEAFGETSLSLDIEVPGNIGFTHSLKYSPNGLFLASSGYDNKTHIFHANQATSYDRCLTVGSELQISEDVFWHRMVGDYIFWLDDFVLRGSQGGWWDLKSQKVLSANKTRTYLARPSDTASFGTIDFTNDESRIAASFNQTEVMFWDTQSGDYLGMIKTPWDKAKVDALYNTSGVGLGLLRDFERAQCTFAFSPNGKQIAIGSAAQTIYVFDLTVGNLLFTLKPPNLALVPTTASDADGHLSWVSDLVYSPSGNLIISKSENYGDYWIRVWDTKSGNQLSSFHLAVKTLTNRSFVSFDSSMKYLALFRLSSGNHVPSEVEQVTDGFIEVWDIAANELVNKFKIDATVLTQLSSLKNELVERVVSPNFLFSNDSKSLIIWSRVDEVDSVPGNKLSYFDSDMQGVGVNKTVWEFADRLFPNLKEYIIWDFDSNRTITSAETKSELGDTQYFLKFVANQKNRMHLSPRYLQSWSIETKDRIITCQPDANLAFYDKAAAPEIFGANEANMEGLINPELWEPIVEYPLRGRLLISPTGRWLVNGPATTHSNMHMVLTDLNPENQSVNNKMIMSKAEEIIQKSNSVPLLIRKSLDEMSKKLTNEELAALSNLIFQILHEDTSAETPD